MGILKENPNATAPKPAVLSNPLELTARCIRSMQKLPILQKLAALHGLLRRILHCLLLILRFHPKTQTTRRR